MKRLKTFYLEYRGRIYPMRGETAEAAGARLKQVIAAVGNRDAENYSRLRKTGYSAQDAGRIVATGMMDVPEEDRERPRVTKCPHCGEENEWSTAMNRLGGGKSMCCTGCMKFFGVEEKNFVEAKVTKIN